MSMTDKCRLLFALAALVVLGGCNDNDSPQEVTPTAAPAPVPHVEPASGGNLARIQAAKVLRIGVKAEQLVAARRQIEGGA